jgi:hypothetical protein
VQILRCAQDDNEESYIMMRTFKILTGLFIACLMATPARADDTAELRAMAANVMAVITDLGAGPGWTVVTQGETLVENSGSYYAVTLPHLSYKDTGGQTLEVGLVAINALKGDKTGEWKVTVALPSPITLNDSTGKAEVTVALGQQSLSAVFNAKDNSFTKLNGRYRTVTINHASSGIKASLPDAGLSGSLKKDGAQTWSGTLQLATISPNILFARTGALLSFATLTMASTFDHYAMADMKKMKDRIESVEKPSPLLKIMAAGMAGAASSAKLDITGKTASLFLPAAQGRAERTVGFDALRWTQTLSGQDANAKQMRVTGGFSDLRVTPSDTSLSTLLPAKMAIDVTIANIPAAKILAADLNKKDELSRILAEAKTEGTITKTMLGNSTYEIDLDAKQAAHATAPLGMVGTGSLKVSGIEALTGAIANGLQSGTIPDDMRPYLKDIQKALLVMMLTGKPGTDSAGKPAKSYEIENTADGRVMVNGQNLQALTGLMQK